MRQELFARNLALLGFNHILEDTARFVQTALGKELVLKIKPLNSYLEIIKEFDILDEALKLQETWNLSDIYDFRRELTTTADFSDLDPSFYRNILKNLQIFRKIKHFFSNNKTKYPQLYELTQELLVDIELEELIDRTIDEYGEIRSSASPELRNIRQKLTEVRTVILTKLKKLAEANRKYLQDLEIVIKNNRFCLQVKTENQSSILGIIHEFSQAQKTVFIEPLESITEQNHYTKLRTLEKEEERKILKTLAHKLEQIKDRLFNSLKIIGRLDLLQAKKSYMLQNNCVRPSVVPHGPLRILGAVNPILKKTKENVVPLDFSVDEHTKVVLISGPNAGGKTVVLKTIGLLCLMTLCGYFIPAKSDTQIPYFENIFVEIGDEQSIENNLSSFSAHIIRLNDILQKACDKSLVLIDEICSSTDPDEGSALAFAILETLLNKKSLTLATSHFGKLKVLIAQTHGMLNAAMEFTTKPTYRLILGSYGESSAFAVSKQLGLSDEILLRAEKYLDKDKLLLAKKLTELNKEIQRYQQLNNELESTKKTLDTVQKVWETNLVNIKEKINEEKREILKLKQSLLLDSRKKIEQLIQEIKQTSADKQAIKKAKEYIQNELTTVNKELAELSPNSLAISNNFDVGDYVYSKTYKKTGLVLSINKKLYTVAFGNIKIDLPASDLIKVPAPAESACELKSEHFNFQKNFETVLNIRGLNKEEAIYLLGKFLDSAYYNNIKEVKIIHGKGKGILKEAIWEHLKDDPRIERFYLGDSFEGGQGVTKVVLKSQI